MLNDCADLNLVNLLLGLISWATVSLSTWIGQVSFLFCTNHKRQIPMEHLNLLSCSPRAFIWQLATSEAQRALSKPPCFNFFFFKVLVDKNKSHDQHGDMVGSTKASQFRFLSAQSFHFSLGSAWGLSGCSSFPHSVYKPICWQTGYAKLPLMCE